MLAKRGGLKYNIIKSNNFYTEVLTMSFCNNCGCQLPEGANICPQCGVPIVKNQTEPPAQPAFKPEHAPLSAQESEPQPQRTEPVQSPYPYQAAYNAAPPQKTPKPNFKLTNKLISSAAKIFTLVMAGFAVLSIPYGFINAIVSGRGFAAFMRLFCSNFGTVALFAFFALASAYISKKTEE